MEITSPNNLWKDYDVDALPLNVTSLSEKNEHGVVVKPYYFDGYTTVDGRVRVFINIAEHPTAKGVVMFLGDARSEQSDEIAKALYNGGFTVCTLDYLGKSDDIANFTLYPQSLFGCNSRGLTQFQIADNEKYSRWYIWTCISRRAIKFLKEKYDSDIFALGVGLGGSTVYKLAAFEDGIRACATLGNILPDVTGNGNQIINYHASLDNYAYSQLCKIPLFMAVSTNAEDGSFDAMSELAANTSSLKHFRIAERAFINGINVAVRDLLRFFDNCSNNLPIVTTPQIKASNSEGSLYFEIDRSENEEHTDSSDASLYVSFCIEDPKFRNWMNIPMISLGNGKYIARINVCRDDKPICAFINVTQGENENTCIYSSTLIKVMPKTLGVKARSGVTHRRIYDGSMGYDGWTSRRGGKINLVKGPFGIDGITNENNSILTFKPGDDLFKVPADTLLQIMISGEPQTVKVNVYDKTNIYSCSVNINNSEDWHKFSLAHTNFKCVNSPLFDWSQILMLELESDRPFVIGSVLWI